MSSSTRPKPRPRPVKSANAAAGSSSSTAASRPTEVKDDDDMFIRQPRKDESTWDRIKKINKEPIKSKTVADSDSEEEEDSPRRKGKKRKHNDKSSGWQNQKNLERYLSEDLSDNDSDIQILEDSGGTQNGHKRKRETQRQRSRSRSITPPPELSNAHLQTMREVVRLVSGLNLEKLRLMSLIFRQTVGEAPRAASPTSSDNGVSDDDDDTNLLPELANIRRNFRAQSRGASQSRLGSSPPPTFVAGRNGSEETVMVTVKWQPHPLNPNGNKDPIIYKIRRNEGFRDLFESAAEDFQVLSENLILTYRGNRFFSSVSPASLHMFHEAEVTACDLKTYDYIRKSRTTYERRPAISPVKSLARPTSVPSIDAIEITSDSDDAVSLAPINELNDSDDDEPANIPASQEPAPVESAGDTIKLTIRSGMTSKDVTLTVRTTAKCGAIVKAFLKKAGLESNYPAFMSGQMEPSPSGKKPKKAAVPPKIPMLCLDGDKIGNNEEIGSLDLEDGDMVEVVGL
ncbi:hypothetical protein VNI00_002718 [Paramarasmius palmivorus]|uniref:Rad60/SUMO-like domain-containing protein n=1 Tax=Paramarasmius palmivorus TaxID=297713 RepID=A0AAW0E1R5_9AGAR